MRKNQLTLSGVDALRNSNKRKHLGYTTNPNALSRWAGLSLAERVKMFHRRFLDIRVSKTLLLRVYLKNSIRFNVARQKKLVSKMDP